VYFGYGSFSFFYICQIHVCRQMHVRNGNSMYDHAEETYNQSECLVELLTSAGVTFNRAARFSEKCLFRFAKSQYNEVSEYSLNDN